jgi:formate dehydrogenase major subunit
VPARPGEPSEAPDAEFPLVLITGRQLEHWHTGSMTRRASSLAAIEPGPTASLSVAELARLGIAAGAKIRLTTRRGAIELAARADDAVPAGAVFVPFAYVEAAANLLTNPALDPVAKIPEFKHCAVRVEAAR